MLVPNFNENIFLSRLILVSYNVISNIKIDVKNHKKINKHKRLLKKILMGCQMHNRKTNSDHEMEKDNLQIFAF